MKIEGLKVLSDKGWKADSAFTADNGQTLQIAANHKVICEDENKDIVNVTFVTPVPLSVKTGQELKGVVVVGNVSKTSFGWSLKAELR